MVGGNELGWSGVDKLINTLDRYSSDTGSHSYLIVVKFAYAHAVLTKHVKIVGVISTYRHTRMSQKKLQIALSKLMRVRVCVCVRCA